MMVAMYYSRCLTLIILIFNIVTATETALLSNDVQLKIKPGDWIEYEIVWSSSPLWPYPVWVRREILTVDGTRINVNITQQLSNGTIRYEIKEGDVSRGTGSAALIFVYPNLRVGDVVFVEGFGNFTIKDEVIQNYLGFDRTVVVAAEAIKDMNIIVYWDKEMGVALEIYNSNSFAIMTKVINTNLFTSTTSSLYNYFIILLSVSFVLWVSLFTYIRNKRLSQKDGRKLKKGLSLTKQHFSLLDNGMQHTFPLQSFRVQVLLFCIFLLRMGILGGIYIRKAG
jgi:hypothetical protein